LNCARIDKKRSIVGKEDKSLISLKKYDMEEEKKMKE
jgi:hypothetical protein